MTTLLELYHIAVQPDPHSPISPFGVGTDDDDTTPVHLSVKDRKMLAAGLIALRQLMIDVGHGATDDNDLAHCISLQEHIEDFDADEDTE